LDKETDSLKSFEGELAARKARVWGVNPVWVRKVRVWGVDPRLSVSIEVLSVWEVWKIFCCLAVPAL
jgi:hypothetical protein